MKNRNTNPNWPKEPLPEIENASWIYLNQGLWALIDSILLDKCPKFRFKIKLNTYYGEKQLWKWDFENKIEVHDGILSLHRWVWQQYNAPLPEIGLDHINRNGWDCRISNLRISSNMQNQWNVSLKKDNKSGFKGVSWNKKSKKWRAAIRGSVNKNKKNNIHLGSFDDLVSAAKAYDKAANELWGERAWLNFPEDYGRTNNDFVLKDGLEQTRIVGIIEND